jgi:Cof subfamily protein (haloacid dehalogenase superfamily)
MDGTILRPDLSLSDRTAACLRTLMDRGIRVILSTGRAVEAAEKYRAALDIRGPGVYFNGAMTVEMPGWKTLAITLLDKETAAFCLALARKTGLYFHAFFPGGPGSPRQRLVSERKGPEWELYLRQTGIAAETGDLEAALADPALPGCVKTMFIGDGESQKLVRPAIEERYGKDLYITSTHKQFLEIMQAGVSKGEGLKTALKALGLDPSQLIAFGDEENDLPMFALAGYALAPANAKETVRLAADRIIGPNSEDGVAAFLEENFL